MNPLSYPFSFPELKSIQNNDLNNVVTSWRVVIYSHAMDSEDELVGVVAHRNLVNVANVRKI
jgi:hypothetical protein